MARERSACDKPLSWPLRRVRPLDQSEHGLAADGHGSHNRISLDEKEEECAGRTVI